MKNKHGIKEMMSRYLKEGGAGWRKVEDENTDPATLKKRNENEKETKRRLLGPSRKKKTEEKPEPEKPENAWTEYEGPSLEEQAAYIDWFLENTVKIDEITDFTLWKNRNKRIEDAKKRSGMTKLELKKVAKDQAAANKAADDFARVLRKGMKKKKKNPQKDWTEYEGPSLSEQADYIDWFLEEGKRLKAAKEVIKGAVRKIFKRKPKDTRTPDQIERDQARDAAFAKDPTGKAWEEHGMSKLGADAKTARSHQIRGKQRGGHNK